MVISRNLLLGGSKPSATTSDISSPKGHAAASLQHQPTALLGNRRELAADYLGVD